MEFYSSYYKILDVPEKSAVNEIKAAFRKQSLVHHPDKNKNSRESNAIYILILNAYNILVDPIKRKEYDTYLRHSTVLNNWSKNPSITKTALQGRPDENYRSNEALLNHFNFLLWDIEDFIHDKDEAFWNRIYSKLTLRQYILKILTFIDKWVLEPRGYQDYFTEARKMKRLDPRDYVKTIGINQGNIGHRPYVSITDYFYNVRKRMDRFLDNISTRDPVERIPNRGIQLIDCIVEAQNLTVHYLSYLLQIESGRLEEIPPFNHSNPCFLN